MLGVLVMILVAACLAGAITAVLLRPAVTRTREPSSAEQPLEEHPFALVEPGPDSTFPGGSRDRSGGDHR